ncbi:MAG: hypothetical protein EOP39_09185 [Rubrivivax sp.]|nr:MAG: hypothetical protein EOP39_09185 [Rubrivivax sp.]
MNAANDALNEALSAVMDGRATPAGWAGVNAAWARDPALRERWAAWHAAGDGLRSTELAVLHRDPEALLDALHAQMPPNVVNHPRRRDWFAPLAVAASFIVFAVSIGALKPPSLPDAVTAAAPFETPRAQGLNGMSFAQTAAGRTLPGAAQESGLPTVASPEIIDWGLPLQEAPASQPRP